jgi:hypothetical protein
MSYFFFFSLIVCFDLVEKMLCPTALLRLGPLRVNLPLFKQPPLGGFSFLQKQKTWRSFSSSLKDIGREQELIHDDDDDVPELDSDIDQEGNQSEEAAAKMFLPLENFVSLSCTNGKILFRSEAYKIMEKLFSDNIQLLKAMSNQNIYRADLTEPKVWYFKVPNSEQLNQILDRYKADTKLQDQYQIVKISKPEIVLSYRLKEPYSMLRPGSIFAAKLPNFITQEDIERLFKIHNPSKIGL